MCYGATSYGFAACSLAPNFNFSLSPPHDDEQKEEVARLDCLSEVAALQRGSVVYYHSIWRVTV